LLPIPDSVTVAPIQFHILVLATFASLIAPFGGFFASGLKRAFKIKDFGDSIPGHGGMTDRMDCQFIMVIPSPHTIFPLFRRELRSLGIFQSHVLSEFHCCETCHSGIFNTHRSRRSITRRTNRVGQGVTSVLDWTRDNK